MASAYQPTTERCESLESIDNRSTCNPMQRWGSGRRQREAEQDRDANGKYATSSSEEKPKDGSSGRPLFRSCLSSHDQDPSPGLAPATSQQSLASPNSENHPRINSTSKLSRVQTFSKKIVQSTEQFLGLGDCEEDHINLQKKWINRKHRHFSKRYGRLVHDDAVDGQSVTGPSQSRMPSVRGSIASFHDGADPTIFRTLSRRQSVATMAWKGLRSRMKSGTLVRDAQQKPVSSLLEVGRSFAPHAVAEGEVAHDDDEESSDDDVFFDFVTSRANRNSMQAMHDIILPKIEEEKPDKPTDEAFGRDEVEGPPLPPKTGRQVSTTSTRGHRLAVKPPKLDNANRRQFGKGLVGRMLNRTIRRKRLTSEVRKQLEHLTDHRPFFTYWVSFVQVIVLIVTLSLYGVSPIGFTKTKRSDLVQRSRGGGLVYEYIEDSTPDNFWIGPDQRSLIILGAKYAPCMRTDTILSEEIKKEKAIEAETGCCIKTDNSGCIQTSRKLCSKSFATFNYNTTAGDPNRVDRVVCGQDPNLCTSPPSVAPHEWSKDITEWPICKKSSPGNSNKYPHMNCEITGRPCCIKQQGLCRIVSRDECEFWNGSYHEEATLCSQVDCLGATCGMLAFVKPDKPDQIYRLWMALFLHAGIIHLACTLVFNFFILRDIEKMAGWLRVCIIYLFSGIGGYLVSAIVIPYQVEVGPSGSMFGIIACLFVELIQSWQMIAQPWKALFKLCGIVLLLLLVGLLPYVDNFAHMAGFMFGFLLAFIFLPYVTFGKWDRRRKRFQILVAFALLITIYVVLFVVFLVDQETNCEGCKYLNCVPFTDDFCENYNLGQKLQSRIL